MPTFDTVVRNDVADGYWGPNLFFGEPTFTESVPEPATWTMMLLGFSATGFALRRSRKAKALTQLA
jgi:hypothetical protein